MITLTKKPKNPIVIEGFPGFGLIGTITTEFLIEHLGCEKIGHYYFEHLPATLAMHNGKIVSPVTVYYSSKFNIVLIHSITAATGVEWEAADVVLDVCKQVNAKEIISIEGVGSAEATGERVFYHTENKKRAETLEKMKIEALEEGIIVGVTSSLLLKSKDPITSSLVLIPTGVSPESGAYSPSLYLSIIGNNCPHVEEICPLTILRARYAN